MARMTYRELLVNDNHYESAKIQPRPHICDRLNCRSDFAISTLRRKPEAKFPSALTSWRECGYNGGDVVDKSWGIGYRKMKLQDL